MNAELVKIELKVNGKKVCKYVAPSMRLADFLREELHLIGTKKGCNAGECGTCSVLINGVLKKSCMIPVIKANHCEILTIEGIGTDGLSIIQRCFIKAGAVQCGYCTPGMIMAATTILKENRHPDKVEIRRRLGGNICRCTGYVKIVEAIELARDILNRQNHRFTDRESGRQGEGCGRTGICGRHDDAQNASCPPCQKPGGSC